MSGAPEILFVSDLHLDQDKPDITRQFVDFLETRAHKARVLYILGDLFEVWLGDDDPVVGMDSMLAALHSVAQSIPVYFIHGNRDFLLGQSFASRLGIRILPDPHVIDLNGRRVALMHGDLLCTDDVDYQDFRKLVRSSEWQRDFLGQSLEQRRAIAAGLRQKSAEAMTTKAGQIMDVNPQTVLAYFSQLGVDAIIHGHTHRPAIHELGNGRKRYVLGDWNPGPSFLSSHNGELDLHDDRV